MAGITWPSFTTSFGSDAVVFCGCDSPRHPVSSNIPKKKKISPHDHSHLSSIYLTSYPKNFKTLLVSCFIGIYLGKEYYNWAISRKQYEIT